MATYKTVYICDSDPEKWFEKREEAERFDKAAEVTAFIKNGGESLADKYIMAIVDRVLERYDITQRWDYAEPAKEDQDEAATT